jgi:hypothetical protein
MKRIGRRKSSSVRRDITNDVRAVLDVLDAIAEKASTAQKGQFFLLVDTIEDLIIDALPSIEVLRESVLS